MKKTLYILLLFGSLKGWSQSISPQVINSAGSHRGSAGGITITDNVGEPFSQTVGPAGPNNIMITEGYLQPFVITPGFSVDIQKSDVSCSDKKDGKITLSITTVYQQHTEIYSWAPASACPGTNCSVLDSLNPGTFMVSVRITYTTSAGLVKQDTSITDKVIIVGDPNGPCKINTTHGVTPNGDGVNDTWIIHNIDAPEYHNNKVSIFNRWGIEVYSESGYDNKTKVWPKPGDKLIASTYFYVIDLGDGSKPIKGWIELMQD